jgi:hypothetical protein
MMPITRLLHGYRSIVPGMDSKARRRAWLFARVAILLVTTVTGAAAILHYASFGISPGTGSGSAAVGAVHRGSHPAHHASRYEPPVAAGSWRQGGGHAPSAHYLARTVPHHAKAVPASARPAVATARARFFRTLPPGARLPSGAQCTRWVRASPNKEVRRSNWKANHTGGEHVASGFLAVDGPRAVRLSKRIDGDFRGTTQEILRWTACKWGINQNMVFAQAAIESWWRQSTLGDWANDPKACPPGHGLGADGRPGLCPQSYGILQNRYPYEKLSWPGIGRSTAMNADTAYAIWRACFDGYETWLNTVPRGRQYHAGDSWGCIGRWFAGRWRTPPALGYIKAVRKYMSEKIWLTPNFRHAS